MWDLSSIKMRRTYLLPTSYLNEVAYFCRNASGMSLGANVEPELGTVLDIPKPQHP